MTTRYLDSLVARGNTSDVYAWGNSAVVKVLRPGIPDNWASREAETTKLVHAAGLPAPAVLDVTMINGRPGVVLERIHASSMWEQMLANPEDIPRLAKILAELQAEISATAAPRGIPTLVERLGDNIERAPLLSTSERAIAQSELRSQAEATALCHFDIHPNNVLMRTNQPVIIDWFDAAIGSPAADIVRSSVLMRHDAAFCHLPCLDPSLIAYAHDQYLAAATRIRDIDKASLLGWESPVLAARLAEPIVDPIRRATYESWQAWYSSQTTPLAVSLQSLSLASDQSPPRKDEATQ